MFKRKNEDDLYRAAKNSKKSGTFNVGTQKSTSEYSSMQSRDKLKNPTTSQQNKSSVTAEEAMRRQRDTMPNEGMNQTTQNNEYKKVETNIPYSMLNRRKTPGESAGKYGSSVYIFVSIAVAFVALTGVFSASENTSDDYSEDDYYEEYNEFGEQSGVYDDFKMTSEDGVFTKTIACSFEGDSYAYTATSDLGVQNTDIYISTELFNELRNEVDRNLSKTYTFKVNEEMKTIRFVVAHRYSNEVTEAKAYDPYLSADDIEMIVNVTGWDQEVALYPYLEELGFKNNVYTFLDDSEGDEMLIAVEVK